MIALPSVGSPRLGKGGVCHPGVDLGIVNLRLGIIIYYI